MPPARSEQKIRFRLDPYVKWAIGWRGDRKGWLRQAQWRSLNGKIRYAVISTPWGYVVADTNDQIIGQAAYNWKSSEIETIKTAYRLLGQPQGVFVDVGANIGTTSLMALYLGFSRACGFELDATNYRVARASYILNSLEGRASITHCAVGAAEGRVGELQSKTNIGDHRVAPGQQLRLARLDDLLREIGIAPQDVALVWMDVQGFEAQVLKGAKEQLRAGTPWVMEFCPPMLGADREALLDMIKGRKITRLSTEDNKADATVITVEDLRQFAPSDPQGWWDILVESC